MINRKDFLKTGMLAAAGILTHRPSYSPFFPDQTFQSRRPVPSKRNFVSHVVDATIDDIKKNVKDPKLAWIFENCFPNTLDTTVQFQIKNGRPDTFVITGDIKAMWLRDSTAQVWPYLPLAPKEHKLQQLLAGVINRQTQCILIDPYANAFNAGPTGSEWDSDHTKMNPWLHERKWEIDSICYPVRLAYGYWKTTGDVSVFDDDWLKAMKRIVKTFRQQQRKDGHGPYHFQRVTPNPYDTQSEGGYGNPIRPVGLICSMFRPSDDATIFPFLIPSNLFAVNILRHMAEIVERVKQDHTFATECRSLADEVETAIGKYAVVHHLNFGEIYAYETDGMGNHLFMDDANVPDLLSLPYLGCCKENDPLYKRTRSFVLSKNNPWYFKGKAAEGIGSPHTGLNRIWPIGITMRAMTSNDPDEIKYCLNMLISTTAGTGFMHESFNKDNPSEFSRKWFAWANTLFGELILKIYHNKPGLLNSLG